MSNSTSRRVDELIAQGIPVAQAIAQAVQNGPQATPTRVTSVEIRPGVFAIATR